MGSLRRQLADNAPGLLLRAGGAVFATATYLLVRDELEPAPLVAARFALGIALFALLVDLGRAFAGASSPIGGGFEPHHQRAEALVDDRYRRVHRSLHRFIDEGAYTDEYEALLVDAMRGRAIPAREQGEALERARESARQPPPAYRPLAMALASGFVVVLGVALAISVLLESAEVPLAAPLLTLVGLGTCVLLVRTVSLGERWGTVGVAVTGALLLFLGAGALQDAHGGRWSLLQVLALGVAGASAVLAFVHTFDKPPWPTVRDQLRNELSTLRRAFVATLLAGIVLFPFKPLLEALFEALGWSFEVPYRMAVIGYFTVAAFLALELAGAWFALGRGEREAARLRRGRIEANEHILEMLEARGPTVATRRDVA